LFCICRFFRLGLVIAVTISLSCRGGFFSRIISVAELGRFIIVRLASGGGRLADRD
jgi:hypothetical protein